MRIKIKLERGAVLPKYTREGDGAMDLVAISKNEIDGNDHGFIEYDTGISMEIPRNYVGLLFPRGSVSNTGLILANCVGVIDSNYRGTVKARFKWIPGTRQYEVGERIVQLIIIEQDTIEWEQVDELEETVRGEGAFGSSGQ